MEEIENGIEQLSPKEEMFCLAYADAESETYGQGTKSAIVAKYPEKSAHNAAWKLKQRPRIKARLEQIYKANASNVGQVMSDLRKLQLKAEEGGDLSTAAMCLKLQGQRYGMFTERMVTDDDQQRELTESEQAEARRIAGIRFKQKGIS